MASLGSQRSCSSSSSSRRLPGGPGKDHIEQAARHGTRGLDTRGIHQHVHVRRVPLQDLMGTIYLWIGLVGAIWRHTAAERTETASTTLATREVEPIASRPRPTVTA